MKEEKKARILIRLHKWRLERDGLPSLILQAVTCFFLIRFLRPEKEKEEKSFSWRPVVIVARITFLPTWLLIFVRVGMWMQEDAFDSSIKALLDSGCFWSVVLGVLGVILGVCIVLCVVAAFFGHLGLCFWHSLTEEDY